MSIFAGKTLMITGGTGSFGNAVLNRKKNWMQSAAFLPSYWKTWI